MAGLNHRVGRTQDFAWPAVGCVAVLWAAALRASAAEPGKRTGGRPSGTAEARQSSPSHEVSRMKASTPPKAAGSNTSASTAAPHSVGRSARPLHHLAGSLGRRLTRKRGAPIVVIVP